MSKKPSAPPRSVPRSGFVDTMAANQQAHIDQLVQQNRALQIAVKRLQDELASEQNRSRQAVQKIQEQWHTERLEWQEGCDTLQACHKLEYLRVENDLTEERQNALKGRQLLRLEKLARCQRDYKLLMFQEKESELDTRIEELEAELQDLRDAAKTQESARGAALKQIKAEFAEYVAQTEADAQRHAEIEDERDRLQEELGTLREQCANFQVTNDTQSTRLERALLQLDGSKTTIDEVQQKNDELSRTVSDLKRQLDQWQDLETRGGAEAELHRKRSVELDSRVRQLEGKLDQAGKREEELSAALEKERMKRMKLKDVALGWQDASEDLKAEIAPLEEQISQLQAEVETLRADLETERAISRPARARKSRDSPEDQHDENEVVTNQPQRKPVSSKKSTAPKSSAKPPSKAKAKRHLSPVVEIEAGPSGVRHNGPPVSSGSSADDAEEIVELTLPPSPTIQGAEKTKAKKDATSADASTKKGGRRKGKESCESGLEIEEVQEPATKKLKGKGKATADSDIEEVDPPRKEPRAKPPSKSAAATRVRKRKASPEPPAEADGSEPDEPKSKKRAGSAAPKSKKPPKKAAPSPSPEVEPPKESQPKKKRKINVFPSAQTGSFNFLGDGLGGGLGIPTELSPIKDTQAVPSRSVSTNGIRSRLVESITRRR